MCYTKNFIPEPHLLGKIGQKHGIVKLCKVKSQKTTFLTYYFNP